MKSPTSNTPRMAFGECHANNTKTANERKIPPDYRRGFSIHNLFTFYPAEETNKKIYAHYGFNEYIKSATEIYPDGTVIDVDYYGKNL